MSHEVKCPGCGRESILVDVKEKARGFSLKDKFLCPDCMTRFVIGKNLRYTSDRSGAANANRSREIKFQPTQIPPLGVMPPDIWREKRIKDLARAIHEYLEFEPLLDNHVMLNGWISELKELSDRFTKGTTDE